MQLVRQKHDGFKSKAANVCGRAKFIIACGFAAPSLLIGTTAIAL
jgi:hypothetical protein